MSATLPGEARLQVMVLPTRRDGITVNDDWDNMGQRQTDSGSVSFRDVRVAEDELLGPPGSGGSVFATLRPCITQSILSNIFGGLAQGAFEEARAYTLGLERPFASSSAQRHADDPYILERFGEMGVQIQTAVCLLDRAADTLEEAWLHQEALDRRAARRVRGQRGRRKSRRRSLRAGRDQRGVRGHGRARNVSAASIRSLLAQRAHAHAARPAGL